MFKFELGVVPRVALAYWIIFFDLHQRKHRVTWLELEFISRKKQEDTIRILGVIGFWVESAFVWSYFWQKQGDTIGIWELLLK